MGTSMASVAFRTGSEDNWVKIRPQIVAMYQSADGLVSNIKEEAGSYAIVSPYGEMGMFLAELAPKISQLTGEHAVMTICVDSDFAFVELYHAGELVERTSIGEVYEEFDELDGSGKPDLELWKSFLKDPGQADRLAGALYGDEVFVEDQLRLISGLTGLPMFDDDLVYREA